MKNLFILILFVSCSNSGLDKVFFGKTTKAEILKTKGEPLSTYSIPDPGSEVYVYAENEKFQFDSQGILKSRFREPSELELDLNYWKNKFQDCDFKENKNVQADKSHEMISEFSCSKIGLGLIYSYNKNKIIKVVEYEAHL